MRILITGAAGMLGQDVRAAAAENGDEVIALTRADLDITDAEATGAALSRARPDAVINCAAYTKVDDAESEGATAAAAINAEGPGILGAAAVAVGAWTVHVSTDYVFDGTKTAGPYLESDPTGPTSVYGSTKLAGEQALAAAAPEAHTIVRSSWLFGLGGPCFPATILRAAAQRPELKVVDDQIGAPTYTPHLAVALLDLAAARAPLGVTHVAGAGETSWFGFAAALVTAASADPHGVAGGAQLTDAPGAAPADDDPGAGGWATVRPCSTAEFPRPAPRPAYSVLRSERDGVPVLPDWTVGLEAYMTARAAREPVR